MTDTMLRPPEIEYPDSDGLPMADNTLQFEWIVTLKGGIEALLADNPDVFVAGDLLWYPVRGEPTVRAAPDVLVAFGRPKGYRGSYKQWEEAGVAPQVAFEVLSPGNRPAEMEAKFRFYDRHGVEEYYVFDPDAPSLKGWLRGPRGLQPISDMDGWVSPRLGIKFKPDAAGMTVLRPDGKRFLTFQEHVDRAEQESRKARTAVRRANREQSRAEQAEARAQDERKRAERLAEKLRKLGIDPDA